jgi:squalene-hopene/tetraprenyl-beta-curcumene cyclase
MNSVDLRESIEKAQSLSLHHQFPEGFWWYTLEANESIGAGLIQLMHWAGQVDPQIEQGLARRIISQQRENGSWALYYDGPSDLSTTVECYFSLKLAGYDLNDDVLVKARKFILDQGGLEKARIFTRIHLALFGLAPWEACPSMPAWFIHFPAWAPLSVYEFSSWARSCIIPLLIILDQKPTHPVAGFTLDEICAQPADRRTFPFPRPKDWLGKIFIKIDKSLKFIEKFPFHPGKNISYKTCETWIQNHLEGTEDIYPFMAYSTIALLARGRDWQDQAVQKAWRGLRRFQQWMPYGDLDPVPDSVHRPLFDDITLKEVQGKASKDDAPTLHQQCCISPVWDTPWMGLALLESGLPTDHPELLKSGRYLLSKQITKTYGDWSYRAKDVAPGGWSFEFQNDYFPDVDDAIQVVHFLERLALPDHEKKPALDRALQWMMAMQSDNGGWGAFDKNNTATWVNAIPFSDHKACLDPPTPDITGRMLELLSAFPHYNQSKVTKKAFQFLKKTQGLEGAWCGRWGVNYIYGTWCVLKGLQAQKIPAEHPRIQKALNWLTAQQRGDGGWGESCAGDLAGHYIPLGVSLPSQTAWALMGLMAYPQKYREVIERGVNFLIAQQQSDGGWPEQHFTGTGFPGHFYIRYHGYRHYFPLMALGLSQALLAATES